LSAADLRNVLAAKLLEFQTKVQPNGLLSENCVGQAYDGASVNRGNRGGLHILMKSIFPNAAFTWCYAHRLQLVCVSSATEVPGVSEFFDVVNQLTTFFTGPIRHSCLEKIQTELQKDEGIKELIHTGDTRWLSHYDSIRRLIALMPSILQALQTLGETRSTQDGTLAFGLLYRIKNFNFIFLLNTFATLLAPFKTISLKLQAKNVDLAQAASFIKSLKGSVAANELAFTEVWVASAKMCEEQGFRVPPRPSRERRQLIREHMINTTNEVSALRPNLINGDQIHEDLYLPIVHVLSEELNTRFNEENLCQMETVSVCFPTSSEFLNYEKLKPICEKFNFDSLAMRDTELGTARRFLTEKHKKEPILTLCDLLNLLDTELFPVLHKIVKILATLPVTTANNERSFSTMKRIKTHLRATMTDERLNRLSLIATEKDVALSLPIEDLVKSFFKTKNRERR
jgi:hypothetical protein